MFTTRRNSVKIGNTLQSERDEYLFGFCLDLQLQFLVNRTFMLTTYVII